MVKNNERDRSIKVTEEEYKDKLLNLKKSFQQVVDSVSFERGRLIDEDRGGPGSWAEYEYLHNGKIVDNYYKLDKGGIRSDAKEWIESLNDLLSRSGSEIDDRDIVVVEAGLDFMRRRAVEVVNRIVYKAKAIMIEQKITCDSCNDLLNSDTNT